MPFAVPSAPRLDLALDVDHTEIAATCLQPQDVLHARAVTDAGRQAEQRYEAVVPGKQPVVAVEHAQALAHVIERALQESGLLLELCFVSPQLTKMLLTAIEEADQSPGQDTDRQRNHRKDDGVIAPLRAPRLEQFPVVDRDGNDQRPRRNRAIADDVRITARADHRLERS